MSYRPEIDGLRAIAVLAVMLFHADFNDFAGGFVGVDVFFVISGYLITAFVISERDKGVFSFSRFLERRARRLVPAMLFMLVAVVPPALFLLLPINLAEMSASLVLAPLFLVNFFYAETAGYFGSPVHLRPLIHTWSLAVEGQFYFLFPPLLLATLWLGQRAALFALIILAAAGIMVAELEIDRNAVHAFYLLHTRLAEFFIGALAALHLSSRAGDAPHWWSEAASLAGLAAVAVAVVTYDASTRFPGLATLLPVLGTAALIIWCSPRTWIGRLLSAPALVAIGLISYSAYLWHQPLLSFVRQQIWIYPSGGVRIAALLVALGLAVLTWRYIELPFRDRRRLSTSRFVAATAGASVVLVSFGTVGYVTTGFEDAYLSRLTPEQKAVYAVINKADRPDTDARRRDNGACVFSAKNLSPAFVLRFDECTRKVGRAVLVIGDSHATNIFNALADARFRPFLVSLSSGGCRPYQKRDRRCAFTNLATFTRQRSESIEAVIYHQSGAQFVIDDRNRPDSQRAFDERFPYAIADQRVASVIQWLDTLPVRPPLIWLGPYAEPRIDLESSRGLRRLIAAPTFDVSGRTKEVFARIATEIDAQFVDASPAVSSGGRHWHYVPLAGRLPEEYRVLDRDGCLLFDDTDHLSACGERLRGPQIARLLNDVLLDTRH